MKSPSELKAEILRLTREYSSMVHRANRPAWDNPAPFEPGKSSIPYAGRVFTEDEVEAAVSSTLDFWLTLGPEGEAFEKELAALMGVKYSLLVNSGSSANLIAICALTTHKLPKERRILPGDEVITVAAGFPTTVAPIIQVGAVPVFIDNDPVTGNARVEMLEEAYVEGKTKAVMMAHTLGNPFDIGAVLEFCRKHNLWLIEDNCDALGCTYTMPLERARKLGVDHLIKIAETGTHPTIRIHNHKAETLTAETLKSISASGTPMSAVSFSASQLFLSAPTGSWGDLSTQSFYPPHHLTLGEGGAVNIVSKPALKTYAESFRDWGRDCWCASGKDNTCHKRFDWQLGELPKGYDHKYIYSHLGYNLKPLDIQAAIGRQQLKKLPAFVEARKRNWEQLRAGLADLSDLLEFSLPTHATGWKPEAVLAGSSGSSGDASEAVHATGSNGLVAGTRTGSSNFAWDSSGCCTGPSWFGFMIRIRDGAQFTSSGLGRELDARRIGSRMLFGGNLVRQPVFVQLRKDRPEAFRICGEMKGADSIMSRAIFLGTYPGLSESMLAYEIAAIRDFAVRSARA